MQKLIDSFILILLFDIFKEKEKSVFVSYKIVLVKFVIQLYLFAGLIILANKEKMSKILYLFYCS